MSRAKMRVRVFTSMHVHECQMTREEAQQVHGSIAALQHGSIAAWQHGSMTACQHGSMAAWQHGSTSAVLIA
jgi:hypothetical protein